MNKIFLLLALCALLAIWYFYPKKDPEKLLRIGIVLPIQHVALDEIVKGFKSELEAKMGAISIEVQNAMGDINLQKSAIQKFMNEHVDLLVPVATGVTQMAVNLAPKEQPILFLAANIGPTSDAAKERPDLMGVIDELGVLKQLEFIKTALPTIKKIALVFSSNDKFPGEAAQFSDAAAREGIAVQKLMIQNLSELYTVSGRIEGDAQAIFILKDSLIASGIQTLVQQAEKLKIPLVTSDEGTVTLGGAFALGVVESDIGRQGADIAAHYFNKSLSNPRIQYLNKISVFINSEAGKAQGVNLEDVIKAAGELKLEVVKR